MDFVDPETAPPILPFTKFEITGESEMLWARLLAYVTGTVNQELLLRSESGRIHSVPGSGLDRAAGAQHDDGGVGKPERLPLSAA